MEMQARDMGDYLPYMPRHLASGFIIYEINYSANLIVLVQIKLQLIITHNVNVFLY